MQCWDPDKFCSSCSYFVEQLQEGTAATAATAAAAAAAAACMDSSILHWPGREKEKLIRLACLVSCLGCKAKIVAVVVLAAAVGAQDQD